MYLMKSWMDNPFGYAVYRETVAKIWAQLSPNQADRLATDLTESICLAVSVCECLNMCRGVEEDLPALHNDD